MPTNYSGRLTAIFAVLFITLLGVPGVGPGIFSWSTIFGSKPWNQKINLKPGIDIAGGTSLTYEIKKPPGFTSGGRETLAEQMAQSLKRRIDPDGVRNLVWRPQGNDRLEIQLPRSAASGMKDAAQRAFSKATDDLKATNVNSAEVVRTVEKMSGEERTKRLAELAHGSASRAALFNELVSLRDKIVKQESVVAEVRKTNDKKAIDDAEFALVDLRDNYADKVKTIESANLSAASLQSILDLTDPKEREQKLNALKGQYPDFPNRLVAIDKFAGAYGTFVQYKNSLDDATDLKRLLKGSGVLEFHMVVDDADLSGPQAQTMVRRLHEKGPVGEANDQMRWYLVEPDRRHDFPSALQEYNKKTYILGWTTPDRQMIHERDANKWTLNKAYPTQGQNGEQVVGFEFDVQGGVLFSRLTASNKGHRMAIILDDKVISAPNIRSEIGSSGIIEGGSGGFDSKELRYLVSTLAAGSLPAQLAEEPISERSITPQLGADNLNAGLMASGIGLFVVAVFLIGYYYLAGVVAFFAVVMNLIIILGVLAMFNATFTLPSIAGIVLTVGTAVDANVLIFERLREEQHRVLPLKAALRNAYDRALTAIVDSNMTTAITSIFLYWFGSEEVKGFGLTLLIGIISSLFTALFVTKTIFAILINKYGVHELNSLPTTYPKWDKLLKPNIDWMKLIWPFVIFSAIFITVGLSAFFFKEREMFDIEFASGTSVQFELKENVPLAKVRDLLNTRSKELPSASVVGINGREDLYEVVTPNENATEVKKAVADALGTTLKVQLPSTFKDAGLSIDQASLATVLPIESDVMQVDGKRVEHAADHVGGVAIVLRNLEPPISPNEVRTRIDRAGFQAGQLGANVNQSRWQTEIDRLDDDQSSDVGNHPAKDLVILVSDPNYPFKTNKADWIENLANPVWRLVNEGVNREANLRNVASFNPQVAASVQYNALMATGLSILVIMAYIWLRFGNLKYGTATVVALVHDTLAVVGAIGITHYIGGTGFGKLFLVYEPFRLNLTLVAAILTIMGYSMIDTIVVFDRIRENRGRYGHISRKVINDSINQTLSRTLLTAGTTLIMVGVMYIWGGPGIHGFTFVLLVGILIGTYSSIAVAAPLLLVGKNVDHGTEGGSGLTTRRSSTGQVTAADKASGRVAELGAVSGQGGQPH